MNVEFLAGVEWKSPNEAKIHDEGKTFCISMQRLEARKYGTPVIDEILSLINTLLLYKQTELGDMTGTVVYAHDINHEEVAEFLGLVDAQYGRIRPRNSLLIDPSLLLAQINNYFSISGPSATFSNCVNFLSDGLIWALQFMNENVARRMLLVEAVNDPIRDEMLSLTACLISTASLDGSGNSFFWMLPVDQPIECSDREVTSKQRLMHFVEWMNARNDTTKFVVSTGASRVVLRKVMM